MEKQVIYFELVAKEPTGELALIYGPVQNTEDYKREIKHLRSLYEEIDIVYRLWNDGTTEEGYLEDL